MDNTSYRHTKPLRSPTTITIPSDLKLRGVEANLNFSRIAEAAIRAVLDGESFP